MNCCQSPLHAVVNRMFDVHVALPCAATPSLHYNRLLHDHAVESEKINNNAQWEKGPKISFFGSRKTVLHTHFYVKKITRKCVLYIRAVRTQILSALGSLKKKYLKQ